MSENKYEISSEENIQNEIDSSSSSDDNNDNNKLSKKFLDKLSKPLKLSKNNHLSMDNIKQQFKTKKIEIKLPKNYHLRKNVVKTTSDDVNVENNDNNNNNNNDNDDVVINNEQQQQQQQSSIQDNNNKQNQSIDNNNNNDNDNVMNDKNKLNSEKIIPTVDYLMKIENFQSEINQSIMYPSLETFEIIWRNILYYPADVHIESSEDNSIINKNENVIVKPVKIKKKFRKAILNDISGMLRSRQLTGIMGPSGSGKTVLLNCIAGFLPIHIRKENMGDILVNGLNSVRIGFVEQYDHLHESLTVRETLLFSSKIRNAARYYFDHDKVINNVMKLLDLFEFKDIYVSRCSNGQRKRISIGIELVAKSDLLMLDEPTTGLDSVIGYQIMNSLKSLTKRRKEIAILATIHQPSARIFALFDNLIILSCKGSIIYQGHPNNLIQLLNSIGLQCPMYTSLSDYILEVASGDFGEQSLQILSQFNKKMNENRFTDDFNECELNSLREAVKRANMEDKRSSLLCTMILLKRCIICNYRNPFSLQTRIPSLTFMAIFLILLYGKKIGKISTCATKYFLWNLDINNIISVIEEHLQLSHDNLSVLLILSIVSLYNSLLSLALTMPNEIYVFRREYNNYSYKILSYFLAKMLSELPFTIITTILFTIALYIGTGQVFDNWNRIIFIIIPCCLNTLIGQLLGILIGTIFYRNLLQDVFSMAFILIPILILSGYFKLISKMNKILAIISSLSFLKPTLNSLMIALYGLDRCQYQTQLELQQIKLMNQSKPDWIDSVVTLVDIYAKTFNQTKLMNKTLENEEKLMGFIGLSENLKDKRSLVLQFWQLSDTYNSYYYEIIQLIIYNIILTIIVYITMSIRLKREKN